MGTARVFSRAGLALGFCLWAHAHPMGNFSVNRYARFDVRTGGVRLTYVLELAEQPSFGLIEGWRLDAVQDREAVMQKAAGEAEVWIRGLKVSVNGGGAGAKLEHAAAELSAGAGGLPVLRVNMRASIPSAASGFLEYEDTNFVGRAGWCEIVVVPDAGVRLEESTHDAADRSRGLTSYPAEGRTDPPCDVRARFRWVIGSGTGRETVTLPKDGAARRAAADGSQEAPGTAASQDYLSRLLSGREISASMLALGLCVAFGLGAMHALSPGHGKTIVAAYLVGSRGTMKHAMLLGALVTFTHTVSVFALGLGVLLFESYIAPDRVIPVLGAVSGLSIVAVGGLLLYRRSMALRHYYQHVEGQPHGQARHTHGSHQHHHHHDDAGAGHSHDGLGPHSHVTGGEVTLGGLMALGVSGGLAPCPSALVLLLTSVALGRAAVGLALLTAFSAGLAGVLIAIGAAVLYAKHLLPQGTVAGSRFFRFVPVVSAGVVVVLGLVMTAVSLGWIKTGAAG